MGPKYPSTRPRRHRPLAQNRKPATQQQGEMGNLHPRAHHRGRRRVVPLERNTQRFERASGGRFSADNQHLVFTLKPQLEPFKAASPFLLGESYIDRKRVGVQGHSRGGYQTAYLITKTNLLACAESGAPVVNMTLAYGGIRWESGLSRAFQYEHQQSRMGGKLWEYPMRYLENSPLFSLDKVETPVLRACSDFGFEASISKFCFKEGKICSCSRVPTAKILTHFKIKFAVRSPKSEIRTSSYPALRQRRRRALVPGHRDVHGPAPPR